MLGKKLRGRYKIIQKLGSGAFGDTYLALDEDLPRTPKRVVKHLKPKDPNPAVLPVARQLFKQEAEALYHLKHEQIPQLFAHFEEDGEFYLVEDYVDGQDLSKAEVTPGKKLSEAEVISLLQGILEVLVYVHQEKVIHLDIKPQNLIKRTQDGKIVLIDFGAVKEINTLVINAQGQTIASVVVGTPGYMPSEQYSGHPQPCSDVYAVGMIGIQALTGIRPDQLPKNPNTLEAIWRNQAHVSPKLADILDKMVRYHPRQRYQSASEALQAIAQSARFANAALKNTCSSTVPLLQPPQSRSSIKKWSRGRKIALLIGLFGGVAVVVGVKELLSPKQTPPEKIVVNFSNYENPDYGITIKYPQNWDKQEDPNIVTNEVVKFISPAESDSDTFRENLTITVENLSSPLSLEEYTNLLKQQILRHNSDAKVTIERESTLAGKRAYTVVYTVSNDQYKLKRMEAWTLKNYKGYSITYEAEADKYDKFLGTAETIIKSLQVSR